MKIEVLVVVEDGKTGAFGDPGDEEVGDGRRPVVSAVGQQPQNLDGAVFGDWCGVLHRHGADRWRVQSRVKIARIPSGVADFQKGDGGNPHQPALDALG